MYLLDTNVISELRKVRNGRADKSVVIWAAGIEASAMFLSVITVLEIEQGTLQAERRDRTQGAVFRSWLEQGILPFFTGRVLPIDSDVARQCARLHVPRPRPERDAFIAATAMVHDMIVVTRNVTDLGLAGVRLFNPWNPPAEPGE